MTKQIGAHLSQMIELQEHKNDKGRFWSAVDYFDVWADGEEGWQVNNLARVEEGIWLADDCTEDEIVDMFKRVVGIRPELNVCMVEYGPGMIEFELETGYPLGRFEEEMS